MISQLGVDFRQFGIMRAFFPRLQSLPFIVESSETNIRFKKWRSANRASEFKPLFWIFDTFCYTIFTYVFESPLACARRFQLVFRKAIEANSTRKLKPTTINEIRKTNFTMRILLFFLSALPSFLRFRPVDRSLLCLSSFWSLLVLIRLHMCPFLFVVIIVIS